MWFWFVTQSLHPASTLGKPYQILLTYVEQQRWHVDQPDVTDIARTNPFQSRASTDPFQTLKSGFTILVERRLESTSSRFVCTWYPTKRNNCHRKLSKLVEFVPTNTCQRPPEKMRSICVSERILSTLSESIRCFHVLVRIDYKLEWEELGESLLDSLQE